MLHLQNVEYTFFSSIYRFTILNHIQICNINIDAFIRIEIIQTIFFDQNETKLEINNRNGNTRKQDK